MRCAMDVRLSSRFARTLLVVAALGCEAVISLAAGRNWVAAHWYGTKNPADWKRAVQLEPGNAAYWDRLGLYEQWDFMHGSVESAIADFRRATQLDPRSAREWMSLAGAYEAAGRMDQAQQAYERAQAAHPISADVAWRYGSFLLRRGDMDGAAAKVERALSDEPRLADSAISQFWEAGAGIGLILDRVLPPRPDVYLAAIDYFAGRKENDAAVDCWERLAALGRPVPLARSLDLLQNLIDAHRLADAERVWREALALAGRPGEAETGGSLIFNGGFEHDLVNGGFGWRQSPAAGTAFDLVTDVAHGGSQSARVVFDGSANVDYGNLVQYVRLAPGQSYRFTAYMRTRSVSTDSGPQFQLESCWNPSEVVAETPGMTGTHPWTAVQTEFRAGATLDCLRVVLRRPPSTLLANKISGTVWVDDVSLKALPGSGGQPR